MIARLFFRLLIALLGRLPDGAIRGLARALFSRSWRRFEHDTAHPREVQTARMLLLVERAKDTAFGREHRFSEITDFASYRARVPIRGYDELEPYLRRVVDGEANVLIPDSPSFFARSSGTTGTPKLIPITPVYLAEYRTPRRVWIRQVAQAFPGLLRGKILTVHSPKIEGRTATGVPFGSITVAMSGSPDAGEVPAEKFGVDPVPRRVFLLEDFELKYYAVLRLCAQERITLAAAVNPSTIVLLASKLRLHAERLAADLEAGTMSGLDAIEPPLRGEIARRLRRDPAAAARLRAAGAAVRPVDLWPEIVGVLCWKGGSAPFYLAQIEALFPGRPIMDYGFLATEGGFSIPLSPEGAKGVLAVGGHVLEFVPEEARAAGASEPCLLADELEPGRRYRIIITGAHGLYRYDINDVVECVGRYAQTAEVRFVHKGGNMLSITGEKIGESHAVEAGRLAAERAGAALAGVCLAVELSMPPRYLFGVEASADIDRARLLEAFEGALREVNIEYAAKRESLRLGPPKLVLLEPGAFERHRKARVAAGAADSHVKPPHLAKSADALYALGVVESYEA